MDGENEKQVPVAEAEETKVVKTIGDQARVVDQGNPELQGTSEDDGEDMMSSNGICSNGSCAME